MRDVDGGQAGSEDEGADFFAQGFAHVGVERAQRLIQQEQAWLGRQAACQGHPLLLAPGKLGDIAIRESCQSDLCQRFPRASFLFIARQSGHFQPKAHIGRDIQVGEEGEILKHETDAALVRGDWEQVFTSELQLAGVGDFQAGDEAQ